LVVLSLSACGRKPERNCEDHIKDEIKPGISLEIAELALEKCGFKTVLNRTNGTLYGNKIVEGIPISKRTQVLVNLDPQDKVVDVKVSIGLVGP
jgi:hypothetical protein